MSSRALFPLRSNASGLLQGASIQRVRGRLKFAALLYEDVLVESGCLMIFVGRESSVVLPLKSSAPHNSTWQTPRERRASRGSQIILEAPNGPRLESSAAIVAWQPTFEPLRSELPANASSWLHFVEPDSPHKPVFTEVFRGFKWWPEDVDGELQRKLPDDYVRRVVIQHAQADLAAASTHAAAVSADPLHSLVIEAGVSVEEGRPDASAMVLPILVPDVASLGWHELSELRRHRNLVELRQIWTEVGAEALDKVQVAGGSIETRVHQVYASKLHRANESVMSNKGGLRATLVGLVVGEIAGLGITAAVGMPIPVVGGALGSSASLVVERVTAARKTRPHRWLAADASIRRTIEGE